MVRRLAAPPRAGAAVGAGADGDHPHGVRRPPRRDRARLHEHPGTRRAGAARQDGTSTTASSRVRRWSAFAGRERSNGRSICAPRPKPRSRRRAGARRVSARRVPKARREPRCGRSAAPDGAAFDVRALLETRGGEAFALHERYMNPQMPRVLRTIGFDADYVRAEGAYLYDRDGRRYLDFLAGFGVFALGRWHPAIDQALRDVDRLLAAQPRADGVRPAGGAARRSARRAHAARRLPLLLHQQRRRVGRDGAEVRALRDRPVARAVRRPRVPRPHHRRARAQRWHASSATASASCSPAARRCRSATSTRWQRELQVGDVAAFVVEPIQGKGVFVAPDDYLARRGRAVPRQRRAARGRRGADRARSHRHVLRVRAVGRRARPRHRREGALGRLRAGRRGDRARATIVEKVFDTMDRAVVHSSTFGQNVLAMTAGARDAAHDRRRVDRRARRRPSATR